MKYGYQTISSKRVSVSDNTGRTRQPLLIVHKGLIVGMAIWHDRVPLLPHKMAAMTKASDNQGEMGKIPAIIFIHLHMMIKGL